MFFMKIHDEMDSLTLENFEDGGEIYIITDESSQRGQTAEEIIRPRSRFNWQLQWLFKYHSLVKYTIKLFTYVPKQ